MASPRPIRIVRTPSPGPADAAALETSRRATTAPRVPSTTDRRVNHAGQQRAFRLATIYLGALIVMYLAFVVIDRASAGASTGAAETGLLYFTGIAAALAVGGVLLALSPTARAVEISSGAVVVEEWTGRRRQFPPLGELRTRVVRRYPAGFLAPRPVEAMELFGGGRARTYHLEEGLIPEARPGQTMAGQ